MFCNILIHTWQDITVTVLANILFQLSNFPAVRFSLICFQSLQQKEKITVFDRLHGRLCNNWLKILVRYRTFLSLFHNSALIACALGYNIWSEEGKSFWSELLYMKNFPTDGQTSWANPSSQLVNFICAQPLKKPLCKEMHDIVWYVLVQGCELVKNHRWQWDLISASRWSTDGCDFLQGWLMPCYPPFIRHCRLTS